MYNPFDKPPIHDEPIPHIWPFRRATRAARPLYDTVLHRPMPGFAPMTRSDVWPLQIRGAEPPLPDLGLNSIQTEPVQHYPAALLIYA